MGGWMALWEKSAELRTRKQHRCDLRILGRCCHKRQVEFAGQNAPDQVDWKLTTPSNSDSGVQRQADSQKALNPVLVDTWRHSNRQNIHCPFMGRMSEMPGPLYKQQGGASLLDKDATRFGEFDSSSLVASEEVKSVMFFEVRNLPAQSRLAYIQSESSSREIEFLGEDIDSEKVADFNVGEHCSKPRLRVW